MSSSRHIDVICLAAALLSLLLTIVFMNGEALGVQNAGRLLGYETRLFDPETVHTLEIVMNDWDGFLETCTNEEYAPCSVVIDGEAWKNVAIRGKGNTSLSNVASMGSNRYSFKIEFDHYDSGKRYYGLDKLCLNNIIQDKTYMKDFLTYRLMAEAGAAAPLCSYVWITVNGADWGLYLAVEGVEESFLRRNYGADAGDLYKPDSMRFGGGGPGHGRSFDMEGFLDRYARAGGADSSGNSFAPPDMGSGGMFPPFGMGTSPGGADSSGNSFAPPDMGSGGMFPPFGMGTSPGGADSSGNSFAPPDMGSGGMFPPFGMGTDSSGAFALSGRGGGMFPPFGMGTDSDGNFDLFRRFGSFGGGMGSSDVKLQYTDDDPGSYSNIFGNAKTDVTKADQTRLIAALKRLSEGEDLENTLDIDALLRYFAVHNFVVNGDSYTGSMIHNYYLYENRGRLSMIPWDYNLAFGGFQGGNASGSVNDPIDTPLSVSGDGSRPMADWIFQNEGYTNLYHQYFREFLENVDILGILDRADALIAPYVEKDQTAAAFFTDAEYRAAVQALRTFCELRIQSVRGQLDGTIPSTDAGQNADSSALTDASGLALSDMGSMMGGGRGRNNGAPGGNGGGFGGRNGAPGGFGGGFGGMGRGTRGPGETAKNSAGADEPFHRPYGRSPSP